MPLRFYQQNFPFKIRSLIKPLLEKLLHFQARRRFIVILLFCFLAGISLPSHSLAQIIYESAGSFSLGNNLMVIENGRKLGIADNKGNIIIKPAYEKIRINKDQTVSGLLPREWKVVDGRNNFLHTVEFDSIHPIGTNLLHVIIGDTEALSDTKGNLLTPMKPWKLLPLENDYIIAREEGKYGILNAGGKITIPTVYDTLFLGNDYVIGKYSDPGIPMEWHVLQFSGELLFKKDCTLMGIGNQGYFSFLENQNWGFFNYKGEKSVLNQYDLVDPFIDGKAIARYMESDGVINRNGEWLIMPRKDSLQHLTKDIYLFRHKNESGLVSTSNGELFSTTNQFIALNHGFLEKNALGKVGLISPEGKRLLTTEYDEITNLQNDTVYLFKKNNHWGIMTKDGSIKLGLKNPIQEMYPMGDQFIGVKIDNKYGFVDINGDLRIANRYDAIGNFNENMAPVKLMGKWGFVDRIERLFVQPLYDEVFPFINDHAIVKKQNKYGIVNKFGTEVLDVAYDNIYRAASGRFVIEKGNNKGLAGLEANILIYPKYDSINDLDNGFVIIGRNSKLGLLTLNGISTVPLIFEKIVYNPFSDNYMISQAPKWNSIQLHAAEKSGKKK